MPSAAIADPGFSSQVAELRRDRRANSTKQQASRRAFQGASGLTPPIVEPSPQYIALSAASQIVTSVQPNTVENFPSLMGGALVTPSSLRLLNGFLDYLLWTVLMKARSSKLSRVRSAVQCALEEKAAKKAIAAAEDELNEYIGGGGMSVLADSDVEETDTTKSEADRLWDIQQIWKKTRLRCMVYTRLGDMEEEDEKEYLDREGLDPPHAVTSPDDSLFISPATAIFLTSIIEFVGENSLIAGGSAASARIEAEKSAKAETEDDFEDSGFETKTPPPPERLTVQDEDMENLAYDCVVGQLWYTWKRALRGSLSLLATAPYSTRPRVAYRHADGSKLYEESLISNADASHIHDTIEPQSWRKHELSQIESVSDEPYKDINRTRSKTLQDPRGPGARRESDEAMERINQHYRSQSLSASPGAKRRAMVLSSQASATKKPSSDDAERVYVPSALDAVEIDRHMEGQGDTDNCRSTSPDLSYYFEASAMRKANREEVNDESVFTTSFIKQDDQEPQDKRHTLPWLIPPKYKESDKTCTSDCTSIRTRSPGTAMSTTYSLHRVNSRTDSSSGKILPSIMSGFSSSKRPFTEESNPSPVSSMFKHLLPRNLTSEGSDRSRADAPSISSALDLDDLLTRDGTIRMTYQSGRMRDMESRRTVERSRLPASAAREPSVRSDNSTRLLSEFIRSTGPDQHPQFTASSQPRGRKGPRFQARDAGYDKEEDIHELAEFIRRGPPEDDIKKQAKASPMDIQKPRRCNTGPLEACLSSSAGESQASSMATRQSETDDTSAPSTPDQIVGNQFNDAKLGSITLSEFLRTMPVPEEAQCDVGLLPAARHFQGFDGKPPSVRTMSTIQNQSRAASSVKTLSMKHSTASIGRNTILSSPSAGGSEYLAVQGDPATRKAKKRLRKHKKPAEDPYRDSPYGERDTPYGAELTRERRTKKFANLLRTRTDSPSPPVPSALSDGGPPSEGGLSGRNGSSSFADSGRTSVLSGSWGGNSASVQVMISGPEEAVKARSGRSNGRVNDSFNSNGSKKQPRAITKLFKRAR